MTDYVSLIQSGVERWNQWRKDNPEAIPDLRQADLRRFNLKGIDLRWTDLRQADFSWADLRCAHLNWSKLQGANLRHIWACYACFDYADLNQACLYRAQLQKALLRDASAVEADFFQADLRQANISAANLQNARLQNIAAQRTQFVQTKLSGADLWNSDLSYANFKEADLTGARLQETLLFYADFRANNLLHASFDRAYLGWNTFIHVDLSQAKRLETVRHYGPSSIGIESLTQAHNRVPEAFFRGAGVALPVLQALRGRPSEHLAARYCFVYFHPLDAAFAQRLIADLQSRGVGSWLVCPKKPEVFYQAIPEIWKTNPNTFVLMVLSNQGLYGDSLESDVRRLLEIEKCQQRRVILPIQLDGDLTDSAFDWTERLLASRPFVDFSGWRCLSVYQQRFESLLANLRLEHRRNPGKNSDGSVKQSPAQSSGSMRL